VLPSNSLTSLAAGPKLVWTKPVVRELFGEERRERLEEIEQADLAANRVACVSIGAQNCPRIGFQN
jgi:hypothetical protein